VTSALPCDSPAVRNRSMRRSFYPKKLPRLGGAHAIGRTIGAGERLAPVRTHATARRSICGG
jgi:hypothetical protein